VRIRGQIGEWPVDLTIELAPEEWAHWGATGQPALVENAPVSASPCRARMTGMDGRA
jgi:hypothetical protein